MKKLVLIIILILTTSLSSTTSWAQGCTMCKQSASNLNSSSAKGLNRGILYLAAFPMLIMSSAVFVWYRHYRKNPGA